MRSGGRVVEGARLESEYTPKAYRGFESLPLRQAPVPTGSQQSTGLDNIGRNQRIFPPARSYRFVTLRRSWGMGIGSQKWGIRRHVERRQNPRRQARARSEEHTSELQSLMRISYAVFCLQKQTTSNAASQINTILH